MITTEQIKELRDSTGISVMQCKKALEEAMGDMEKARVILRKKSGELALKKSDRTFGAGIVQAYVHSTGRVASLVELVCETDFVSGNEEFKILARDIAMHVTASNPKFLSVNEITDEVKNVAKEVFIKEVEGKPKDMQEKILEGKLNTYFADQVLLNQSFIKNPDVSIEALILAASQKFGEKIAIARFNRFAVLEK
jgi:elongation factor Ts